MTDLTSIGTLFAFALVCGGILLLPRTEKEKGKFRVPYVSGRYWVGVLMIITAGFALYFNSDKCYDFVHSRALKAPDELVNSLQPAEVFALTDMAYKDKKGNYPGNYKRLSDKLPFKNRRLQIFHISKESKST